MNRIAVLLGVSWATLRRDRAALVLTFVLPLVFFTVFASVFGNIDDAVDRTVAIGIAAEADGVFARHFIDNLGRREGLALEPLGVETDAIRRGLASGRIDAAVVVPAQFDAQIDAGEPVTLRVYADAGKPLAAPAVSTHLMAAMIQTAADLGDEVASVEPPVAIEVIDALGAEGKRASTAFFAAGLGVLFLMLSLANRAAVLHDERDNGTLERMLASQLSLDELLLGRLVFYLLLGIAQITAMFVWAALAFDLDLFGHLAGFTALAVLSAASAASLALVLAFACRSREQLSATATVVVLMLAAVGGNLFPRFLMPEWLQTLGTYTFNGWALEGFQQVFWYEAPVQAIAPHALVLVLTTIGLYAIARLLATRWVYE